MLKKTVIHLKNDPSNPWEKPKIGAAKTKAREQKPNVQEN